MRNLFKKDFSSHLPVRPFSLKNLFIARFFRFISLYINKLGILIVMACLMISIPISAKAASSLEAFSEQLIFKMHVQDQFPIKRNGQLEVRIVLEYNNVLHYVYRFYKKERSDIKINREAVLGAACSSPKVLEVIEHSSLSFTYQDIDLKEIAVIKVDKKVCAAYETLSIPLDFNSIPTHRAVSSKKSIKPTNKVDIAIEALLSLGHDDVLIQKYN